MSRRIMIANFFIVSLCFFSLISFSAHAEDISRPHGITASGLGTTVSIQDKTFDITGGTQKGGNLFHSFGKFNVHSGETAKFSDTGIRNTIGRITGGEYSWINGILKSDAENLYLLNPGGFVFGSGAMLDLKGSFHVSTADYLRMGDNERFYAVPRENEVLSVAEPSSFGFVNNDAAPIKISGRGAITGKEWKDSPSGLHVTDGKTVSVVGGDIEIKNGSSYETQAVDKNGQPVFQTTTDKNGEKIPKLDENGNPIPVTETVRTGEIRAPGGQINIIGVASSGEVKTDLRTSDSGNQVATGGDITISEKALIDVSGEGGGSVFIKGNQFVVSDSDIESRTHGNKAGGTVDISADSVLFTRSKINCTTDSTGDASAVHIIADESVIFTGDPTYSKNSAIFTDTGTSEVPTSEVLGNGGNVSIEAKDITFRNGSRISSKTFGTGKGGTIALNGSESIRFSGTSETGGGFLEISSSGNGDAGSLIMEGKNISFKGVCNIIAYTAGNANGGKVTLKADEELLLSGSNIWIASMAMVDEGTGGAGTLIAEAKNILIKDGAMINAYTAGNANGGSVTLKADEELLLSESNIWIASMATANGGTGDAGTLFAKGKNIYLKDGVMINAYTLGKGNGGKVTLKASDLISFTGEDSSGQVNYIDIGTDYEKEGAGNSGTLCIEARDILVKDGMSIWDISKGKGNGGTISLKATESISFSDESSAGGKSKIFVLTSFQEEGAGDGGSVVIEAKNVSFENGSYIANSVRGKGDGGNITLKASESIIFSGESSTGSESNISVINTYRDEGAGDGGSILIEAKNVLFEHGAYIANSTDGKGDGGNITLNVSESLIFSGEASNDRTSYIGVLSSGEGNAGTLLISAKDITFKNGASILGTTKSNGKGGNVSLKADNRILFSGQSSKGNDSSIGISSLSYAENSGDSGSLFLGAKNIIFDSASIDNFTLGSGNGGNISMEAENIIFQNNATIDNTAEGKGNGGNIQIKASDTVSFSSDDKEKGGSHIVMFTMSRDENAGNSGTLQIEAENIRFTDGSGISVDTIGRGNAGNVTLLASDSVIFSGEDKRNGAGGIRMSSLSQGKAGNLLIKAENIAFTDGTDIRSSAFDKGSGGVVQLEAGSAVKFSGEDSNKDTSKITVVTSSKEDDAGNGGTLSIQAGSIFFTDGAQILGSAKGKGDAGEITLRASDTIHFSGESGKGEPGRILTAVDQKSNGGNGGNVRLESKNIVMTGGVNINTGTYGPGNGGDIEIIASENVLINGMSSKGKAGGFFSASGNTGGNAGNINLRANELTITDKGEISSSSKGTGNAGTIMLNTSRIRLDKGASISSENISVNSGESSDISERDNRIIILGDIVEAKDVQDGVNDGKSGSFVNTGDGMIRYNRIYDLSDTKALNGLKDQYALSHGDLAYIKDTGDGTPGWYIYSFTGEDIAAWVRFDRNVPAANKADMASLNMINNKFYITEKFLEDIKNNKELFEEYQKKLPPYNSGDVIRVEDAGDGKPAVFVFTHVPEETGKSGLSKVIRLNQYEVSDIAALNALSETTSVRNGDVAFARNADNARFIYHNGQWIRFNNIHPVKNADEIENLTIARTGDMVKVADAGNGKPETFIYNGKDWITLNDRHVAPNIPERDRISAENGDVVYVSDTDGKGNSENFLYSDGKWVGFVSGNAAAISIKADDITLSNDSRITSTTKGHGKAGNINISASRLELDSGSAISSESDSTNFGGDAGDITVAKEIRTDENGKVITVSGSADVVRLLNSSTMTTETNDAGGGKITVSAKDMLYLNSSGISTSVSGGDGKGGNIDISTPEFTVMNNSLIRADAYEGDGGNIHIEADHFLKSFESIVSASSALGIDGIISIESPEEDVTAGLISIPTDFIDAGKWLPVPCFQRSGEKRSRFTIDCRDSVPLPPDGCLGAPVFELRTEE